MFLEIPDTAFEIDDVSVHARNFSRPTAGECHASDEVTKRLTLDRSEDERAFVGRQDAIANEPLRFPDVCDRILDKVLFLDGPIECAFQGAERTILARRVVAGFLEPAGDVLAAELRDAEPPIQAVESLENVLVPAVGAGLVILAAVAQEAPQDAVDDEPVGRCLLRGWLAGFQLLEELLLGELLVGFVLRPLDELELFFVPSLR